MRIFFSILLFISFAIRPTIELSLITYYQLNIKTIVDKYCVNKKRPRLKCNGKCYLMNKMKTSTPSSQKKTSTHVISEVFIPLYFQEYQIMIEKIFYDSEVKHNWKSPHSKYLEIEIPIDHPPKIV
ncbi:hypothetical protein [Aquimarina algicola]|uniref:Uncharacterized protein n=1 Tax=Aquimarina algicola TaxID=2589995 RepID=A0A504J2R3_9FLAO|nr:hypothetical protein [Aquimarina algicola]TPN85216.1 hypothetical protein FHK87_14400 [Aquimarina algicola]